MIFLLFADALANQLRPMNDGRWPKCVWNDEICCHSADSGIQGIHFGCIRAGQMASDPHSAVNFIRFFCNRCSPSLYSPAHYRTLNQPISSSPRTDRTQTLNTPKLHISLFNLTAAAQMSCSFAFEFHAFPSPVSRLLLPFSLFRFNSFYVGSSTRALRSWFFIFRFRFVFVCRLRPLLCEIINNNKCWTEIYLCTMHTLSAERWWTLAQWISLPAPVLVYFIRLVPLRVHC